MFHYSTVQYAIICASIVRGFEWYQNSEMNCNGHFRWEPSTVVQYQKSEARLTAEQGFTEPYHSVEISHKWYIGPFGMVHQMTA